MTGMKTRVFLAVLLSAGTSSCRPASDEGALSAVEFEQLMERLSRGWSTQDTELAVSCFTRGAVYMEPPNIQLYVGHEQLRPYFDALTPGTFMRWHELWFDEETQTGAGEYSFGNADNDTADHGIAVVELADGAIRFWREYQRTGPAEHSDFLDTEGKDWEWHIGNYP